MRAGRTMRQRVLRVALGAALAAHAAGAWVARAEQLGGRSLLLSGRLEGERSGPVVWDHVRLRLSDTLWPARSLLPEGRPNATDWVPVEAGGSFEIEVPHPDLWTLEIRGRREGAELLSDRTSPDPLCVAMFGLGALLSDRQLGAIAMPKTEVRRVRLSGSEGAEALLVWRTPGLSWPGPVLDVTGVARPDAAGWAELLLPASSTDDSTRFPLTVEVHARGRLPLLSRLDRSRWASEIELGASEQSVALRWSVIGSDDFQEEDSVEITALGVARGLLPWAEIATAARRGVLSAPLAEGQEYLVVRGRRSGWVRLPSSMDSTLPAEVPEVRLTVPEVVPGRAVRLPAGRTPIRPVAGAVAWWRHDPRTRSLAAEDGQLLLSSPRFPPIDGSPPELIAASSDHHWLGPALWSSQRQLAFRLGATQLVRVLSAAGEPIAGVELAIRPKIQIGSFFLMDRLSLEDLLPSPLATAVTDASGLATLSGLEPGARYHVRSRAVGWLHEAKYLVAALDAPPLELRLEPGGRYIGWVEDEGGRPVPGARVILERAYDQFDMGALLTDFEEMLPDTRREQTDAQGVFLVEDLPAGQWVISAEANGLAPASAQGVRIPLAEPEIVPPATGADPDPRPLQALGTLRLGVGRTVNGRVIGPDERPLGGARVEVTWPSRSNFDSRNPARVSVTDGDGRFALGALPISEQLTISARRDGFADAPGRVVEAVQGKGGEEVVLQLEPGRRITVVVIDDEGTPVPDAQAYLRREPESAEEGSRGGPSEPEVRWEDPFPGTLSATGGSDGVVTFESVPLAKWTLEVRAATHMGVGAQRLEVGESIALLAHEVAENERETTQPTAQPALQGGRAELSVEILSESRLEVVLARGATLEVALRTPEDTPAPGRMLGIFGLGSGQQMVTTDIDGLARFTGLGDSGRVEVTVLAEQGELHRETIEMAGAFQEATITLPEMRTLRGVARDSEGELVGGARVSVLAPDLVILTTLTDARGSFEASGLPAAEYVVLVRAPGLSPGTVTVDLTRADGEVEIELQAGAEIHGRLVDARGGPAKGSYEGWQVIAEPLNEDFHSGNELRAMTQGVAGGTLMAPVDLAGTFRFSQLQPGTRVLTLTRRDGGQASRPHFVDLFTGEVSQLDLEIEARSKLSGTVVLDGRPVSGVRVRVQSKNATGVAVTDADGAFELRDVADGTVVVRAILPGEASAELELEVAGDVEGVWLELTSGVVVAGRVLDDQTGQPLQGATVYLRPKGPGADVQRQTDRRGAFRLATSPGTYTLQAVAEGYALEAREVTLEDQDRLDLDLRLRGAAEVTLRVRFADGSVPRFVTAWEELDGRVVQRRCEEVGEDPEARLCTVRGVGSRVTLWVAQNYNGPAPARVGPEQLETASGQPIDVVLPVTGGVTVVLRSLLERGVESATVRFVDAGTGQLYRRVASGGLESDVQVLRRGVRPTVARLDVPVGTWWVELNSEDGQTFRDLVEVRSGEQAVVTP